MVMLVESEFTTFLGHNLTITFLLKEESLSSSSSFLLSPSSCNWCLVDLTAVQNTWSCMLSLQLFPFSSFFSVPLLLCLPQSSHERSSLYSPSPYSLFQSPSHGFPSHPSFSPCISADTCDQGPRLFKCLSSTPCPTVSPCLPASIVLSSVFSQLLHFSSEDLFCRFPLPP